MIDYSLLFSVLIGVSLLILLILKFKFQPFIALLISSILVGVLAGIAPLTVMETVKEGMGSTLGFVAVVIDLGAMFGAILEHSGGAEALAQNLLQKFGEKNASWALMMAGFFIAIPVFFDVAFILLIYLKKQLLGSNCWVIRLRHLSLQIYWHGIFWVFDVEKLKRYFLP